MTKKEIEAIVCYAMQFFMIPETWHVCVNFKKGKGTSQAVILPEYLRAEVTFGADVLTMPDEEAYEAVGHEIGHVLIGTCWYNFGSSLRDMLEEQKMSWFMSGWTTSEENMATMLGRMFARGMIDSKTEEKETKMSAKARKTFEDGGPTKKQYSSEKVAEILGAEVVGNAPKCAGICLPSPRKGKRVAHGE